MPHDNILNAVANRAYLSAYFAYNSVVVVTIRQYAFLLRLVICKICSTSIAQFATAFSIKEAMRSLYYKTPLPQKIKNINKNIKKKAETLRAYHSKTPLPFLLLLLYHLIDGLSTIRTIFFKKTVGIIINQADRGTKQSTILILLLKNPIDESI